MYLYDKANPIATRNTANIKKLALICAIQILKLSFPMSIDF
jgi:hypothetical protein